MKFTTHSAKPISVDEKNRTIRVRFTDETMDDWDTVLTHDGWDFDSYLKNPVVRLDHDPSARAIVGQTLEIIAVPEERAHDAIIQFDTDEDSDWAFGKAMRGFLRGVSAGFDVLRMEGERIMSKALREISLVSVPSNANTLTRAAKEGTLSTTDAERMISRYERSADHLRSLVARGSKEDDTKEDEVKEEDVKKLIDEAVAPFKEYADKFEGLQTDLSDVSTKLDELQSKLSEEKPKGTDDSKSEKAETKPGNGSGGQDADEDEEISDEDAKRILDEYEKDLDEEFKADEESEE